MPGGSARARSRQRVTSPNPTGGAVSSAAGSTVVLPHDGPRHRPRGPPVLAPAGQRSIPYSCSAGEAVPTLPNGARRGGPRCGVRRGRARCRRARSCAARHTAGPMTLSRYFEIGGRVCLLSGCSCPRRRCSRTRRRGSVTSRRLESPKPQCREREREREYICIHIHIYIYITRTPSD